MSHFKAKCTKFDFRWGSAPDRAREAYRTPPDLYSCIYEGLLFTGRNEIKDGKGEGEEMGEKEVDLSPSLQSYFGH